MSNEISTVTGGTQFLTSDKKEVLRKTICADLSDTELQLFFATAERTGLDPILKQIQPIPIWDQKANAYVMQTVVRIDGLRLIADRSGTYCPGKSPKYVYKEDGSLDYVETFAWKLVDGKWFEISNIAHYDEYCRKNKSGQPSGNWRNMPKVMTAKCSEAGLLRRGWPQDCSNLYAVEEMDSVQTATAKAEKKVTVEDLAKALETRMSLVATIVDRCQVQDIGDIPADKLKSIYEWVITQPEDDEVELNGN